MNSCIAHNNHLYILFCMYPDILFYKCFGNQFRMCQCTNQYMFPYKLFCIRSCISRHKLHRIPQSNCLCIHQSNQYNLSRMGMSNHVKMTTDFEMDCHLYYYLHNHVCMCLYISYSIHHCSLWHIHIHKPYSNCHRNILILHRLPL